MPRKRLTAWATVVIVSTCGWPQQWDLSTLPAYQPEQKVSGVIKNFGSGLNGLLKSWEDGFRKYNPGIKFDDNLPSSDGAIGGLEAGADLAPSGREPVLTEYLSFNETFNCDPLEITVATGAYDVKGRTWAIVIFVNKANPISKLTMKQLDGIFGSERTGGYHGYQWMPQEARSAEENIRTWGQLGLKGEWANRPIQTYGYAPTGMRNFFELKVFHGGDKWNPNYREYVESDTKMEPAGELGQSVGSHRMLEEVAKDKYGIAWSGIGHASNVPGLKAIALASRDGLPYVPPTKATVYDRSYPLARSVYIYLHRAPGKPVDPKLKEFLRYVLSREGQQDVARQGEYLPLTEAVVREQLQKLE